LNWQAPPTTMGYAPNQALGFSQQQQQQQNMFQTPPPMQTSQQLIGAMRPPMAPLSSASQPAPVINRGPPKPASEPPKKRNDLLDFDVFSEFRSPTLMTSLQTQPAELDKTDGANQSAINCMLDISSNDSPSLSSGSATVTSNSTSQTKKSDMDDLSGLIDISLPPAVPPAMTQPPSKPVMPAPVLAPPSHTLPPAAPAAPSPMSQENYTIPLEALKPGTCFFYKNSVFGLAFCLV